MIETAGSVDKCDTNAQPSGRQIGQDVHGSTETIFQVAFAVSIYMGP